MLSKRLEKQTTQSARNSLTRNLYTGLLLAILTQPALGISPSPAPDPSYRAIHTIKANQVLIKMLDPYITNLANEETKQIYRQSIESDMLAQIHEKAYRFEPSYKASLRTQGLLVEVFDRFVSESIKETEMLFDEFASMIVLGKDNQAKTYFRIAHREVTMAKVYALRAKNVTPLRFYSVRNKNYQQAVWHLREGRRYGFRSIVEVLTPPAQKRSIRKLTFSEQAKFLAENIDYNTSRIISLFYDSYSRLRYPSLYQQYFDTVLEEPIAYNTE